MDIRCNPFGTTHDGRPVERYTLTDGAFSAAVLTLGGVLQSLIVPDRNGVPTDVVLGFDTAADYQAQDCYIGALLGRSEAAVNAHLSRGRNRLRTMLGGECCEHGV